MTSLENLGAMVFIAALIVVTAFPASASVVLEIPAFQLLIRHNSHTPRTTAATMLSSRRVSFRVEPDIKPDIGRIWTGVACGFNVGASSVRNFIDLRFAPSRLCGLAGDLFPLPGRW
jgi:hypothetical protein